jgi:hypothetical protein
MAKKTKPAPNPHDRLVEAASHLTRSHTFVVMGICALGKAGIDAAPLRRLADGLVSEARKCLAEAI